MYGTSIQLKCFNMEREIAGKLSVLILYNSEYGMDNNGNIFNKNFSLKLPFHYEIYKLLYAHLFLCIAENLHPFSTI